MTHGIQVNDIVHVRGTFVIAKVIGIDDPEDRYPASLCLVYDDQGISCRIKARADECTVLEKVPEEMVGLSNIGFLPF